MSLEHIETQQGKFRAIADKIRNYTVETGIIIPNTFDDKIDEVYEAGRRLQYDTYWDIKQNYGNRKDWRYAFLSAEGCETDETLRPKYDIECTYAESMFYGLSQVTKLKKGFDGEEDLQIDTSKVVIASWMFFNMKKLIELPPLDFSSVTYSQGAFYNCNSLTKLHLTVSENTVFNDATFYGCSALDDLKINGVIGKDADFSHCVSLSGSTILMEIMANLKDYRGTGTTHTLVLGEKLIERLLSHYHLAIFEAIEKGWEVV